MLHDPRRLLQQLLLTATFCQMAQKRKAFFRTYCLHYVRLDQMTSSQSDADGSSQMITCKRMRAKYMLARIAPLEHEESCQKTEIRLSTSAPTGLACRRSNMP